MEGFIKCRTYVFQKKENVHTNASVILHRPGLMGCTLHLSTTLFVCPANWGSGHFELFFQYSSIVQNALHSSSEQGEWSLQIIFSTYSSLVQNALRLSSNLGK
ncbi:hypothetical protein ACP275_07G073700 [Erythranthe tilingii]